MLPRPPLRLLAALGCALALGTGGTAAAAATATPVPSPVHVVAGAAASDGKVSWTPPVQRVTGEPGELVAVDLALDDGTGHELEAELRVRSVEIDAIVGPRATGASDAVTLAVDSIALRPGDRGTFRGVAEIPVEPTVVAVEARVLGDPDARPTALILLAPAGRDPELSASVEVDGMQATVTVANGSPFPALVDVGVAGTTWVGPSDDVQVGDVLVPGRGERTLDVELSRGFGRRTVAVAAAARGAEDVARAETSAWPPRTLLAVGAAALVALAGLTAVQVLRRS